VYDLMSRFGEDVQVRVRADTSRHALDSLHPTPNTPRPAPCTLHPARAGFRPCRGERKKGEGEGESERESLCVCVQQLRSQGLMPKSRDGIRGAGVKAEVVSEKQKWYQRISQKQRWYQRISYQNSARMSRSTSGPIGSNLALT
jgi:hypothetical protein